MAGPLAREEGRKTVVGSIQKKKQGSWWLVNVSYIYIYISYEHGAYASRLLAQRVCVFGLFHIPRQLGKM